MIRIYIPGFYDSDKGGPRWGDAQIIDDGTNYVVIDGYCGIGATRLVERLKKLGIKSPWLYLSHYHYDHYAGLEAIIDDPYFSPKGLRLYNPGTLNAGKRVNGEVKSDVENVMRIVRKAKAKKIPIRYLKDGDSIRHGAIRFRVYRDQPATLSNSSDPHGWAYMNDGSLCFWFPNLGYWTSGDGPKRIYDMCKAKGAKPVFFKIPHHGNNCPESQAQGMKSLGALYCYDNDYTSGTSSFLKTGRQRCIEAGIQYFDIHGDINFIAARGKAYIYKDGKHYGYACGYTGKSTLRKPDDAIVEKVIAGELGTNDTRTTNLIDLGYWPSQVQTAVNKKLNGDSFTTTPTTPPAPAQDPEQTAPKLRDMSELHGIDVGYSQGKIDWDKVAPQIDFAIIECGYGQDRTDQDDSQYQRNTSECERLGIPYGIYLYSYAGNSTRGSGEADHALRLAKGKQLSLPIYQDLEESKYGGAAQGVLSVFGAKIEAAGYWAGLYTGEYYYNRNLYGINRFTKWIARYGTNNGKPQTKPNVPNVTIWQYSSKGRVSGISGNVDVNIMYGDDLLKSVTGLDYIQAARDVWAGKYGNDDAREKALTSAGFDPRIVQHFVNRLIK